MTAGTRRAATSIGIISSSVVFSILIMLTASRGGSASILAASILMLIGGIIVMPLFVLRPEVGILILLLTLYAPWAGYSRLATSRTSYALTAALFALLSVAYVIRNMILQKRRRVVSSLDRPMFTWCLVIGISAVYGAFRGNDISYVISDAFQASEFFIMFWLTTLLITSPHQVRFLIGGILVLAFLNSISDLILYLGGSSQSGFDNSTFYSSVSLESGVFRRAIDFIISILLPVIFSVYSVRPSRSPWVNALLLGTLLMGGVVVLISFTRTMWLAVFVAFCLVLRANKHSYWRTIRRILPILILGSLSIVALSRLPAFQGASLFQLAWQRLSYSYEQIFDPANENQRLRQIESASALTEIARSPVFGIGLGGTYYGPGNGLPWTEKHWIHNTYVAVPLRMGIPGSLVLLWMSLSFILASRKVYHSVVDPTSKAIIVGIWGAFICLAIQSVTMAIWFMHPTPVFAGMAWALVFILKPRSTDGTCALNRDRLF